MMREVALAVAMLAVQVAFAQSKAGTQKSSDQPFAAFRALDKRLTALQEQLRAVEASLQADEKQLVRSHAWVGPAKKLRSDIRYLQRTSHRLRVHYRHSHFGHRAFLALETKAKRMGREADVLVRARAPAAAKKARDALSREMLPLIVQFQAITTNYGTLHCGAGQTACCEPKKRESTERVPEHECQWTCVKSRRACRAGIAGPTAQ